MTAATEQLQLPIPEPWVQPDYPDHATIDERFAEFHRANPHVYRGLREQALKLVSAGETRLSINMLFEVLRYHRKLQTAGDDYLLNNNYRALYARMLMERELELEGVFETRRRKAAV